MPLCALTGLDGVDGSSVEKVLLSDANTLFSHAILGPIRICIFADRAMRELWGASFYGIHNLRGNVVEMAIPIGNANGCRFVANYGDGELDASGTANFPNGGWGYRSGDFYNPQLDLRISARNIATFAGTRRVVHFGVTRNRSDAWVAQQLREATAFGQAPRFLIRDRDRKYGDAFTRVAEGSRIEILKTPYRAPKANAICERFLGSVRRECLDHFLILGERQCYRVIKEYVGYFNRARPHQGIEQRIPEGIRSEGKGKVQGKIVSFPALGGLYHDYRRAA